MYTMLQIFDAVKKCLAESGVGPHLLSHTDTLHVCQALEASKIACLSKSIVFL
jgi:hypothetical protein